MEEEASFQKALAPRPLTTSWAWYSVDGPQLMPCHQIPKLWTCGADLFYKDPFLLLIYCFWHLD